MAKRGENISAEFKFKVVIEALREESSLAEIASKYNITSKSIQNWKREFLEHGKSIFNKSKELKKQESELLQKDEYIEKLHGTVGELTVQLNWLKKKSVEIELLSKRRK